MRLSPEDLKRNPELAALIAQKLGEDAAPRQPERRHAYRRRPTSVRDTGCTYCGGRRAPTRAEDEEQALGVAFAYVSAGAVALWLYAQTQPLRHLLRAGAALTPVWPGWWALAVLIGSWYAAVAVARRIGLQGWRWPLAWLAAFAVLVVAMTACFGLMNW